MQAQQIQKQSTVDTGIEAGGVPAQRMNIAASSVSHAGPMALPALQGYSGSMAASGIIQAKLKAGAPGDKHEREADRNAAAIMSRSDSPGIRDAFSGVGIHNDGASHKMAESIGARAFTTGRDIYFGSGEYDPVSLGGRRLLAHELTHVAQQEGMSGEMVQMAEQPNARSAVIKAKGEVTRKLAYMAANYGRQSIKSIEATVKDYDKSQSVTANTYLTLLKRLEIIETIEKIIREWGENDKQAQGFRNKMNCTVTVKGLQTLETDVLKIDSKKTDEVLKQDLREQWGRALNSGDAAELIDLIKSTPDTRFSQQIYVDVWAFVKTGVIQAFSQMDTASRNEIIKAVGNRLAPLNDSEKGYWKGWDAELAKASRRISPLGVVEEVAEEYESDIEDVVVKDAQKQPEADSTVKPVKSDHEGVRRTKSLEGVNGRKGDYVRFYSGGAEFKDVETELNDFKKLDVDQSNRSEERSERSVETDSLPKKEVQSVQSEERIPTKKRIKSIKPSVSKGLRSAQEKAVRHMDKSDVQRFAELTTLLGIYQDKGEVSGNLQGFYKIREALSGDNRNILEVLCSPSIKITRVDVRCVIRQKFSGDEGANKYRREYLLEVLEHGKAGRVNEFYLTAGLMRDTWFTYRGHKEDILEAAKKMTSAELRTALVDEGLQDSLLWAWREWKRGDIFERLKAQLEVKKKQEIYQKDRGFAHSKEQLKDAYLKELKVIFQNNESHFYTRRFSRTGKLIGELQKWRDDEGKEKEILESVTESDIGPLTWFQFDSSSVKYIGKVIQGKDEGYETYRALVEKASRYQTGARVNRGRGYVDLLQNMSPGSDEYKLVKEDGVLVKAMLEDANADNKKLIREILKDAPTGAAALPGADKIKAWAGLMRAELSAHFISPYKVLRHVFNAQQYALKQAKGDQGKYREYMDSLYGNIKGKISKDNVFFTDIENVLTFGTKEYTHYGIGLTKRLQETLKGGSDKALKESEVAEGGKAVHQKLWKETTRWQRARIDRGRDYVEMIQELTPGTTEYEDIRTDKTLLKRMLADATKENKEAIKSMLWINDEGDDRQHQDDTAAKETMWSRFIKAEMEKKFIDPCKIYKYVFNAQQEYIREHQTFEGYESYMRNIAGKSGISARKEKWYKTADFMSKTEVALTTGATATVVGGMRDYKAIRSSRQNFQRLHDAMTGGYEKRLTVDDLLKISQRIGAFTESKRRTNRDAIRFAIESMSGDEFLKEWSNIESLTSPENFMLKIDQKRLDALKELLSRTERIAMETELLKMIAETAEGSKLFADKVKEVFGVEGDDDLDSLIQYLTMRTRAVGNFMTADRMKRGVQWSYLSTKAEQYESAKAGNLADLRSTRLDVAKRGIIGLEGRTVGMGKIGGVEEIKTTTATLEQKEAEFKVIKQKYSDRVKAVINTVVGSILGGLVLVMTGGLSAPPLLAGIWAVAEGLIRYGVDMFLDYKIAGKETSHWEKFHGAVFGAIMNFIGGSVGGNVALSVKSLGAEMLYQESATAAARLFLRPGMAIAARLGGEVATHAIGAPVELLERLLRDPSVNDTFGKIRADIDETFSSDSVKSVFVEYVTKGIAQIIGDAMGVKRDDPSGEAVAENGPFLPFDFSKGWDENWLYNQAGPNAVPEFGDGVFNEVVNYNEKTGEGTLDWSAWDWRQILGYEHQQLGNVPKLAMEQLVEASLAAAIDSAGGK